MQFVSAISLEVDPSRIAQDIHDQLGADGPFDLVVVFVRPQTDPRGDEVLSGLYEQLAPGRFIGCTAGGVVGAGREIEDDTATAVLAARLPGVRVDPLPDLDDDAVSLETDDLQACIVLVDPFSTATEALLHRLDQLAPGIPVIGGVASWASAPGRNRLAQDGAVANTGLVGVTLRGNVRVSTIVSQGCRPVGDWFTVTSSRSNLVQELDGKPPLEVLQQVFSEASPDDQKLMRSGILLGRGVAQQPDDLGHGSFIIRVVLGADRESGAISVADRVREGEFVQFHVRDAQSARDDLEMLLTPQVFEETAAGALLFTCNGRGERFFGERDADVSIIGNALGEQVPVTGFFCGGEIGPIGSANFVHGYTASLAVFRPASSPGPTAEV
ncbi:MAG: FIST C-terminal domain-containing protein [Chloroflexi bacterium]|nr:FIST C-terminal domain-containing protein [Chloroflexota bacterium]